MFARIIDNAFSVLLSNRLYALLNAGIIVCSLVESYALPIVMIKWIIIATKYGSLVVGCRNPTITLCESKTLPKLTCFKYSLELVTIQEKPATIRSEDTSNCNVHTSQISVVIANGENYTQNQLSYCGQDCSKIPASLGKMFGAKVKCLDLSFNHMSSLRGLELFVELQDLILDNNRLGDGISFPRMPLLKTLSLNNNQITDLELLLHKISDSLPNLTYLSLLSNRACPDRLSDLDKDESDYQRYRYFVLYKLPSLRFLDSRRVTRAERLEAQTRGQFSRVHRPPPVAPVTASSQLNGKRLPIDVAALGDHKGAYGKISYKYTGKHSEGNRFIVNSDL